MTTPRGGWPGRHIDYITEDLCETMLALAEYEAAPYGFHYGELLRDQIIEYRGEFIAALTAETAVARP